jgi:hypothetical protein
MNSQHTRSYARPATLGVLLAGAALFLGACSTPSVVRAPDEKSDETPVTYAKLHQMMTRLAEEPSTGATLGPIAALTPSYADLGGGRILAANP